MSEFFKFSIFVLCSSGFLSSTGVAGDFFRFSESPLLQGGVVRAERPARGGFSEELKLFTRFATFAETVDRRQGGELLWKHRERVTKHPTLQTTLSNLSEDRFFYEALKTFLEGNGKFWAGETGGHYRDIPFPEDPFRSLIVMVGLNDNNDKGAPLKPTQVAATSVHELLHFVFDKLDADVSERPVSIGADHFVIYPLEVRFSIIDLIDRKMDPYTSPGQAPMVPGLAQRNFNELISKNDRAGLIREIESPTFVKDFVENVIVAVRRYMDMGPEQGVPVYEFSKDQLEELSWLWAYNAVLSQEAYRLGLSLNKPKTKLKDLFKSKDVRKAFKTFVQEFSGALSDTNAGLLSTYEKTRVSSSL